MFFQGRGNTYLQVRLANGNLGPAVKVCQDAISVALATDSFEHTNKCGPVDAPDYRGIKSSSGTVTLSYVDVDDKKFAIAVLGTVHTGGTGTITDEVVCDSALAGDSAFIGGKERRRTITSLTLEDHSVSPAASLTVDTDYTLDAASGRIDFLVDVTGPVVASTYHYADPNGVSMLSAAQEEYFLSFENINKANANDPGSVEVYRIRFDPAKTMDFLSDELQIMELSGTMLADSEKAVTDTEFGQYGRRVL